MDNENAPPPHCVVCGVPLAGFASLLLRLKGVKRSARNPRTCNRCNAHLEEGKLVELTVLFADLSGFTSMTNRIGADQTYSVVDDYLRLATTTLTGHGAMIDKYIGDAVMAFFNVPVKREDHAAAAVAAAAALQAQLPELSKRVGQPLAVTVGISTGFARVGRLGSDELKDYTAIGEAVNQAARLQAQARPSEIVVSDGVYRGVAASYPGKSAETLTLKGFAEPCVAYRLNGPPAVAAAADWRQSRPAMNWTAIAMALLGSGCLSAGFATAISVAFGLGSATSIVAVARLLDGSALRRPFMVVATVASLAILFVIDRQRRERRRCMIRNACVKMTASEKRSVMLTAGLALTALALVAIECAEHLTHHGAM